MISIACAIFLDAFVKYFAIQIRDAVVKIITIPMDITMRVTYVVQCAADSVIPVTVNRAVTILRLLTSSVAIVMIV